MKQNIVARKAATKKSDSMFGFRLPMALHKRMRKRTDINWTATIIIAIEEILKQAEGK